VRCGGASGFAVLVRSLCAAEAPDLNTKGMQPPNMRLKLAGALVLKEAVGSCPGGHGLSSNGLAPAGESPAA